MEINEKINLDYINAKETGQRLLRFALEDLVLLTKKRLNQNEILNAFEHLIDNLGHNIIKKARKRKNIENDVFQMVLLNKYVCEFRYNNKNRRIVLAYRKNEEMDQIWNDKVEVEPNIIKKNWIF